MKGKATSVAILVYAERIDFNFFEDVWDEEGLIRGEIPLYSISMPRTRHHEVAIYTGDDIEPYDYTDWFGARKPLSERG